LVSRDSSAEVEYHASSKNNAQSKKVRVVDAATEPKTQQRGKPVSEVKRGQWSNTAQGTLHIIYDQ